MNQKASTLVLIALVIVLGGYFLYQQQTKSTSVTQSTVTTNETANPDLIGANWQTYTNTEAKVSFQYPLDWVVKEENPDSESTRISIRGKQGEILLDYGSGFGGACPTGYEDFNVGNAQTQACHDIYNGIENWSLSAMKKNGTAFNNINYSGFVTANAPYKDNRDVILKILSTFIFADQNQGGTRSPNGSYIARKSIVADYNTISVEDKYGAIVISDLVKENSKEIGYNVKFKCQCGTSFKSWVDDSKFTIEIVNGGGEEYEYTVDAKIGRVDESSFKKIK